MWACRPDSAAPSSHAPGLGGRTVHTCGLASGKIGRLTVTSTRADGAGDGRVRCSLEAPGRCGGPPRPQPRAAGSSPETGHQRRRDHPPPWAERPSCPADASGGQAPPPSRDQCHPPNQAQGPQNCRSTQDSWSRYPLGQ